MEKAGDWVLLGFAILASIPFIFANIVILVYRRSKHFQAQGGVDLIVTGSVAGLVWICSSFVVNDHFNRKGFLHKCELWSLWLRMTFGMCLWLLCLTLRLHRMFLLSKGRNGLSWKHVMLIPLLLVPSAIVSFVATALGAFNAPAPASHCCDMKVPWRFGVYFTVVPAYFSGLVIFLWLTRGSKDPLLTTEHKHTCEYTAMAFIIFLLCGNAYLTKGHKKVAGRCFLTFCVCSLVFFHFWVRMGWPVYLCLFRPEASSVHSVQGDMSSSEGAVLQALEEVTERAEMFKMKIRELEVEKQELLRRGQLLRELLQQRQRVV